MADKDKKSGLGEMLVFLAIAAVLMAVLYKLKTGVWNWATANSKAGLGMRPHFVVAAGFRAGADYWHHINVNDRLGEFFRTKSGNP